MPDILVGLLFVGAIASYHSWRQHRNRDYVWFGWAAVVGVLIKIWDYVSRNFLKVPAGAMECPPKTLQAPHWALNLQQRLPTSRNPRGGSFWHPGTRVVCRESSSENMERVSARGFLSARSQIRARIDA